MSLFQQQREVVRQTIVDTSIRLFRTNGYDLTTIDEITKSVGIAKGTFYNFFGSKRDVLLAWAAQVFRDFNFRKALDQKRSFQKNMTTLIDLLVDQIAAEELLFKHFLKELMLNYQESTEGGPYDFKTILSQIADNSGDSGRFCNGFKEVGISVLNDALFMAVIGWFRQNKPVDGLKPHLNDVLHVCLFGILTGGVNK